MVDILTNYQLAQQYLQNRFTTLTPEAISEHLTGIDISTESGIRKLAYMAVMAAGEQKHPIRIMMTVSKTAVELAQELGIKDLKEFGANMGDIDLARGPIEEEFEHIKELAVTPGTVKYRYCEVLDHLYREILFKQFGSGYRSPWITDSTKQAFIEFQKRANLPLIVENEDTCTYAQDIQTTQGAAEGLEKAIAITNTFFSTKDLRNLTELRKRMAQGDTSEKLARRITELEAKRNQKATFIHIGPSFSATDKVIDSSSILETPQLSPQNRFVINEEYIANIEGIIGRSGNCCILIEDTPNPLGKRLSEHELILLDQLMEKYPDLMCIIDHAYIGLAQDEDLSTITKFRKKYLDRTISVASLSKVTASPGKRIGGIIFPNKGELKEAVHNYYSSSNPSEAIHQEAWSRAQLNLLLAGDNKDDIYKLIALATRQAGMNIEEVIRSHPYAFYDETVKAELTQSFANLGNNDEEEYSKIYVRKPESKYVEKEVSKLFKARTRELYEVLNTTGKFEIIIEPENTMYVFARLPEGMSALDFYLHTGIAAVPGEAFGKAGSGWIRLSVGMLTIDKIREMGEIICSGIT